MKKITLAFITVLMSFDLSFAQVNLLVEAPLDNSTTQVRAPNGLSTSAYLRACALVTQSDLINIPLNSTLTIFGFTLSNTSTVTIPVAGNFTVYLENTTDVTYLKGTSWSTIPTGMTNVYASVMTIPLSSTTTSITMTLSTPFVYTGNALYVAYDWYSAGPYSSQPATFLAEGLALNPGCASGSSGTSAPTTLGTTAFRPSFLFGFSNPYTNDVSVVGIESPGNIPAILNTPHIIRALVRNGSSANLTSISVSLNVTGANPFSNVQTIPALNAGSSTLVSFPAYNPLLPGAQTVSVSVASDQNNANNSSTYAQNVTCSTWGQNPAAGTFTSNAVGFAAGTGILSTPFLNPVTSTIKGIRGAISNGTTNVGNSVYGVLMTSAGVIVATTNTLVLTTGMLSTFQQFDFAVAQNLSASTTYYIGIAQMLAFNSVAYYPAGTIAAAYLPANLYYSSLLTGGALTSVGQSFGYFGLEAVLGHTANVVAVPSPSTICLGDCTTINATGTTNYTWSVGGSTSSITVCPTITTTYSISATNTLGCNSSAMITVTVNPIPNVNASTGNAIICLGKTATLTASGAATYTWNLGPTTATVTDSPLATTVYTVTGSSAFGCVKSNTVEVTVNSFTPGITSSTAICEGQQITINATGGAGNSYTWSTGFTGFANLVGLTPSITTSYSVTSVGQNGCKGTNETTITVNSNPTVTAVAQRTVMCKGETNTLTATGATSYSWSTASTNTQIIITPTSNITYNYGLTGTNASGCTHTAQVSVKVNLCTGIAELQNHDFSVSIFPNPFTEIIHVTVESVAQHTSVKIYNALGSLVKQQIVVSEDTAIDLQEEANGLYFVYLLQDNKVVHVSKLVKR